MQINFSDQEAASRSQSHAYANIALFHVNPLSQAKKRQPHDCIPEAQTHFLKHYRPFRDTRVETLFTSATKKADESNRRPALLKLPMLSH